MDRFKRRYIRDPKTGRFVPSKEIEQMPYQTKAKASLFGIDWIDYVDVIESQEQERV